MTTAYEREIDDFHKQIEQWKIIAETWKLIAQNRENELNELKKIIHEIPIPTPND